MTYVFEKHKDELYCFDVALDDFYRTKVPDRIHQSTSRFVQIHIEKSIHFLFISAVMSYDIKLVKSFTFKDFIKHLSLKILPHTSLGPASYLFFLLCQLPLSARRHFFMSLHTLSFIPALPTINARDQRVLRSSWAILSVCIFHRKK